MITDELQTPTCLKPSSLRFKQKACNMVRTHVKLIVEEAHVLSWVSILSPAIIIGIFSRFQDNVQSMITALSTTAYPKWKGEVDPETHLGSFHCIVGLLSNHVESITDFLVIIHIQVEVQPSRGIGMEGVEISGFSWLTINHNWPGSEEPSVEDGLHIFRISAAIIGHCHK